MYFYLYTDPSSPKAQLAGVGAGDFTHRPGDRWAVAIREVGEILWEAPFHDGPYRQVKFSDPKAQVFENGQWGPPRNRRGEIETVAYVFTRDFLFDTRDEAEAAAYKRMLRA